jgi:hypothetical protein
MIKREIAILQSSRDTHGLCVAKSNDFNDVPDFNNQVTLLGAELDSISDQSKRLEVNTQGYTKAKNASKETLLQLFLPVLRRIKAYAGVTKNDVLINAVKFTPSQLQNMNESMLSGVCRIVLTLCQENMGDLKQYGLSDAMLTDLEKAIADFDAKLIGTPIYRAEQKAARQIMNDSFGRAAEIFKTKLDLLVELIHDSNLPTYLEYQSTRKVVITSIRTLSLKGLVLDALTREPIPGAVITIAKAENPALKKKTSGGGALDKGVKISAAKGGFRVKSLEAAMFTITATKQGYAPQTITIYINDNERTSALLELTQL